MITPDSNFDPRFPGAGLWFVRASSAVIHPAFPIGQSIISLIRTLALRKRESVGEGEMGMLCACHRTAPRAPARFHPGAVHSRTQRADLPYRTPDGSNPPARGRNARTNRPYNQPTRIMIEVAAQKMKMTPAFFERPTDGYWRYRWFRSSNRAAIRNYNGRKPGVYVDSQNPDFSLVGPYESAILCYTVHPYFVKARTCTVSCFTATANAPVSTRGCATLWPLHISPDSTDLRGPLPRPRASWNGGPPRTLPSRAPRQNPL